MPIDIGEIEFGEVDAKNEVIEQEKFGSSIFRNGFRIPPGVNTDKLIRGAKCFIYGQKGCGKTSLLLYVRGLLEDQGAKTKTVLFKSGITERERQKIAGAGFSLVDSSAGITSEYDYKINWLWYIYRNLLRLISEEQVYEGWDIAVSLKRLLGVYGEVNANLLSDLSTKRIKGFAKAGLKSGPLTIEIAAEIEAISKDDENSDIEIIDIVEKYLPEIVFHPRHRSVLLFDELELFWNRADQRERDLFLIRDLLYAVSRVNHSIGTKNVSLGVIASVRSEVLYEVNRVGPEVSRDVSDRGVRVHWNVKSDDPTQPILQIIEKKINASEIENDELPTEDVWTTYFDPYVFGRDIKQYLLDISMYKPRNLVSLLSEATEVDPLSSKVTDELIQQAQGEFSKRSWVEIEEGLLGEYTADTVRNIKAILIAFQPKFSLGQFQRRVEQKRQTDPRFRQAFRTEAETVSVIESLYRLGAIGNIYFVNERGRSVPRNHWMFRDFYDAILDKEFEVHESLRKELQLPFRNN